MNSSNSIMNKVTGFIQYKHIHDIMQSMSPLRYAVVKGCPLSYFAYSDYGKRSFFDTDLLVDKKDIGELEKIMLGHGFGQRFVKEKPVKAEREKRMICLSQSHQILPYYRYINHQFICFDLNFDIFWGEYEGKRIPISEFLSDTIELDIYGVRVKTLPPLKTMIQLILHHYKDMNSIYLLATRKNIKQDMFKDVYYLLKNNLDTITLNKLYKISSEYEIVPYVFYILYYTGQIYHDEILQQYIEAFKTPKGQALLNCYGLCAKEQKEWKYEFKTRLHSNDLYRLIKSDLSEKDREKIAINKRVFMRESE